MFKKNIFIYYMYNIFIICSKYVQNIFIIYSKYIHHMYMCVCVSVCVYIHGCIWMSCIIFERSNASSANHQKSLSLAFPWNLHHVRTKKNRPASWSTSIIRSNLCYQMMLLLHNDVYYISLDVINLFHTTFHNMSFHFMI